MPNYFASVWARNHDLGKVRLAMVVMTLFGIAPLVVRIFEFPALKVMWDANAYGSIVWLLLGLHTSHLITDLGVLTVRTQGPATGGIWLVTDGSGFPTAGWDERAILRSSIFEF